MTGNIFFDCVFLFLICYALVNIFYSVSEFLLRRHCRYPNKAFLVIDIAHEDKSIECDVRCAVSKSLNNKCALVILCDDLSLEEYTVIWRLTDCYEHVVVVNRNEFYEKLETAKNISSSL